MCCLSGCSQDAPSPGASLTSRIVSAPLELVERNADRGIVLSNHVLTGEEAQKFSAALEALTPLHVAVLRDHLRSIVFVDGLPANAQTVRADPSGDELRFDLIFNARVLGETLSEFATRKERGIFSAGDAPVRVSIVAGSMDAVVFVLLHEATHIVDGVLGFTYANTGFRSGVWEDTLTPEAAYRGGLLDSVPQRSGGEPLDIENAQALYEDLESTPFVSVYASLADVEEIAELVAWRHMTEELGQPYRIEVREADRVVYSYEPMKSPLVQGRLDQLSRFDLQ